MRDGIAADECGNHRDRASRGSRVFLFHPQRRWHCADRGARCDQRRVHRSLRSAARNHLHACHARRVFNALRHGLRRHQSALQRGRSSHGSRARNCSSDGYDRRHSARAFGYSLRWRHSGCGIVSIESASARRNPERQSTRGHYHRRRAVSRQRIHHGAGVAVGASSLVVTQFDSKPSLIRKFAFTSRKSKTPTLGSSRLSSAPSSTRRERPLSLANLTLGLNGSAEIGCAVPFTSTVSSFTASMIDEVFAPKKCCSLTMRPVTTEPSFAITAELASRIAVFNLP